MADEYRNDPGAAQALVRYLDMLRPAPHTHAGVVIMSGTASGWYRTLGQAPAAPRSEFIGAHAGRGETPYLKVLGHLFGDRAQIANAAGWYSIYGHSLAVTPWTKHHEDRDPAGFHPLFEDNAELGLGFRLAADKHLALTRALLTQLASTVGAALALVILNAPDIEEHDIRAQRIRVAELKTRLLTLDTAPARDLLCVVDHLVRRSIWIVGGDDWAFDIGDGGLDHILASDRDVNILVLDSELHADTDSPASIPCKDLALLAVSYGNVYVAQVDIAANAQQTVDAFREAEAFDGPSLIIASSQCIGTRTGMMQPDLAVPCGYWPLMRFDPALQTFGHSPFRLDSPRPTIPFETDAYDAAPYEAPNEVQAGSVAKYCKYAALAAMDGGRFTPGAVATVMGDAYGIF